MDERTLNELADILAAAYVRLLKVRRVSELAESASADPLALFDELKRMTVAQLRRRHFVIGEWPRSNHRTFYSGNSPLAIARNDP